MLWSSVIALTFLLSLKRAPWNVSTILHFLHVPLSSADVWFLLIWVCMGWSGYPPLFIFFLIHWNLSQGGKNEGEGGGSYSHLTWVACLSNTCISVLAWVCEPSYTSILWSLWTLLYYGEGNQQKLLLYLFSAILFRKMSDSFFQMLQGHLGWGEPN